MSFARCNCPQCAPIGGGCPAAAEFSRLSGDYMKAIELLREVRDGEVNPEDEADKFLRDGVLSKLAQTEMALNECLGFLKAALGDADGLA